MHLACRHHDVYECHIKNVAKIFRTTTGPDHPFFKKLLDEFSDIQIDQTKLCKFQYGVSEQLDNAARDSLEVISKLLEEGKIPIGDYWELAELVKLYIYPEIDHLTVQQPGAVHYA